MNIETDHLKGVKAASCSMLRLNQDVHVLHDEMTVPLWDFGVVEIS